MISTDQDKDGYGIRMLLANSLYKYWPELFHHGLIYILNTPIIKVKRGKEVLDFYSTKDFEDWDKTNKKKYTLKYFKGLGTFEADEFEQCLSPAKLEQNLINIKIPKGHKAIIFELLFSKEKGMSDKRKDWLNIEQK